MQNCVTRNIQKHLAPPDTTEGNLPQFKCSSAISQRAPPPKKLKKCSTYVPLRHKCCIVAMSNALTPHSEPQVKVNYPKWLRGLDHRISYAFDFAIQNSMTELLSEEWATTSGLVDVKSNLFIFLESTDNDLYTKLMFIFLKKSNRTEQMLNRKIWIKTFLRYWLAHCVPSKNCFCLNPIPTRLGHVTLI